MEPGEAPGKSGTCEQAPQAAPGDGVPIASAPSEESEPSTKEAEALAEAVNHSAERVQTLWFSFLIFMVRQNGDPEFTDRDRMLLEWPPMLWRQAASTSS